MKKRLMGVLAVLGMVFATNASAQHDVKMNFLGFVFGQYGALYENLLSDQTTVGGGINYYSYKIGDFKYSGLNIAPEFRFYFDPDEDADGYFAGPYLKFRSVKSNGWDYTDENFEWQEGSLKNNGVAIGLGGGRKWVTRSGFLFETYAGFGKYLMDKDKYDNKEQEEYYTSDLMDITGLSSIDFRAALTIGWRFGW